VSLNPPRECSTSLTFDAAEILRRFGGDEALFAEIIHEFLGSLPELRASVVDAVEMLDAPALMRAGHRLRGALLEIAALPAAELARQIESSGRGADVQRGVELWSKLSPLLDALAAELHVQTAKS
jgi:HPt (histidine-containing phosphotransfer) domain-containing protein